MVALSIKTEFQTAPKRNATSIKKTINSNILGVCVGVARFDLFRAKKLLDFMAATAILESSPSLHAVAERLMCQVPMVKHRGSGASFGHSKYLRSRPLHPNVITPEKFYKGESQEKTHIQRPEFFLLPSPRDRARSVLSCRAMISGCERCSTDGLGFLYQRFSSAVRDEAGQF